MPRRRSQGCCTPRRRKWISWIVSLPFLIVGLVRGLCINQRLTSVNIRPTSDIMNGVEIVETVPLIAIPDTQQSKEYPARSTYIVPLRTAAGIIHDYNTDLQIQIPLQYILILEYKGRINPYLFSQASQLGDTYAINYIKFTWIMQAPPANLNYYTLPDKPQPDQVQVVVIGQPVYGRPVMPYQNRGCCYGRRGLWIGFAVLMPFLLVGIGLLFWFLLIPEPCIYQAFISYYQWSGDCSNCIFNCSNGIPTVAGDYCLLYLYCNTPYCCGNT